MRGYAYRRRWSARMLRRLVRGGGGGGFGLRPCLRLLVPMSSMPSPLLPNPDGCMRPQDLPWEPPSWFIWEDRALGDRWREQCRQKLHGLLTEGQWIDAGTIFWKYIDIWPQRDGRWLLVELSAYDRGPMPLAQVARSLTAAWVAGTRIGVQLPGRPPSAKKVRREESRWRRSIRRSAERTGPTVISTEL